MAKQSIDFFAVGTVLICAKPDWAWMTGPGGMGNLTQLVPHPISARTSLLCTAPSPRQLLSTLTSISSPSIEECLIEFKPAQCSLHALSPLSPSAPPSGLSPKFVLSPRPCLAVRTPSPLLFEKNTWVYLRQLVFWCQLQKEEEFL